VSAFSCGNERRPTMSADLLRAKLRNFPAPNLTLRLLLAR
jgi:hypothetical protein